MSKEMRNTAKKTLKKINLIFFFSIAGAFFLPFLCFGQPSEEASSKKRDPFVALVNSSGKIKTGDELFPEIKKKSSLSMNIVLKAIIWDTERPLAMINNKIYREGNEITEGLKLQKINPNSVILDDNGNLVTITLRKPEKK